jgi:hypothetical protein
MQNLYSLYSTIFYIKHVTSFSKLKQGVEHDKI